MKQRADCRSRGDHLEHLGLAALAGAGIGVIFVVAGALVVVFLLVPLGIHGFLGVEAVGGFIAGAAAMAVFTDHQHCRSSADP